jgi:hypothetical protein
MCFLLGAAVVFDVADFDVRIQLDEVLGLGGSEAAIGVDKEAGDGLAAVVGNEQRGALRVEGDAVNVALGRS